MLARLEPTQVEPLIGPQSEGELKKVMLSVTIKSIVLNVITLSVSMLNVVMLNVMTPE